MTCKSYSTTFEYDYDDNICYPKDFCSALARAAEQLPPIYIVTKTMIDYGFQETVVSCSMSSTDAIRFMMNWDGNGDCLHLYHGSYCLGYVDLCSHSKEFTPLSLRPCIVASSDDIPF